jgi:hypothetical protein
VEHHGIARKKSGYCSLPLFSSKNPLVFVFQLSFPLFASKNQNLLLLPVAIFAYEGQIHSMVKQVSL